MKRKLFIYLIFLVIIFGIIGWWYQRNLYSKEILKLEIFGPERVTIGEEVEYSVKYKNNGNVRLEKAWLLFEYPEYSVPSNNKPLRINLNVEDIYPGEERIMKFKGRLFGKEGETKTARASLTYQPKDLISRYESKTSQTALISFVPITLDLDILSKIETGREMNFLINYFSNVNWPISDLRIIVEYPSGFEFISSRPAALEKNEWKIGILNKTEGGRIEVKGKLTGKVGESKNFRAVLGMWKEGNFIVLKEITKGTEIIDLSLEISQRINGSEKYVASPGDTLHYEIFFKNVGRETLEDLFLIAKLEGEAFDFSTLRSDIGQLRKGDNSLIWDGRKVLALQFLDPEEEGKVEFWVDLKNDWTIPVPSQPSILKSKIIISQTQVDFETKINSKLTLSQEGFYHDEAFGNSGPLPPRVGEETTYTIFWKLKNYYNEVKDVKIKTVLSGQTRLTGKIFPETAKFTFDSVSREIVWSVGDLPAGSGITEEELYLVFQVGFTPAPWQVGMTPHIIEQAEISAEDQWTGMQIKSTAPAIDTTLPDDPEITKEQGIVQ